jgi:AraC-like DNA-binding protein
MKFLPSDFRLLRFRSEDFPASERIAVWQEVLSQMLLKVEVESQSKQAFQVDASLRALPGIRFGMAVFGPCVSRRTRDIVTADNDDSYLVINTEGSFSISQANTETVLDEGDACFLNCSQEVDLVRRSAGRIIFARFERAPLAGRLPDIDEHCGQIVRSGNDALQLLTAYLVDLDDKQRLVSPDLRSMVITHIYDLLGLVLSSSLKGLVMKRGDSPGAVQLRALKKYVARHLADPDLSITTVCGATQLTPRHVQRLFEAELTTFSKFVLLTRLQSVHAALKDPKQRHRGVADIALAHGFGDVSAFNRAFRRHFGASPSNIRQSLAVSSL